MKYMHLAAAALMTASIGGAAAAKDKPAKTYIVVNEDVGVPVFA